VLDGLDPMCEGEAQPLVYIYVHLTLNLIEQSFYLTNMILD
jgi:hypothetical protein